MGLHVQIFDWNNREASSWYDYGKTFLHQIFYFGPKLFFVKLTNFMHQYFRAVQNDKK